MIYHIEDRLEAGCTVTLSGISVRGSSTSEGSLPVARAHSCQQQVVSACLQSRSHLVWCASENKVVPVWTRRRCHISLYVIIGGSRTAKRKSRAGLHAEHLTAVQRGKSLVKRKSRAGLHANNLGFGDA